MEPGNYAAGTLCRIITINSELKNINITSEYVEESYCVDKWDIHTFPQTCRTTDKYQHKDKEMAEKLKTAKYLTKSFRWGGNTLVRIRKNYKNVVQEILQKCVVNWYHT